MQFALRGVLRSQLSGRSFQYQTVLISRRPLRFTHNHEVVKLDDTTGIGIIGITDHAQSALGDVVFVELPSVGTKVKQGDAIGAVESVKAASEVYAPISGTVEEINSTLADQPGLLNKSPENEGWLCKIKLSEPAEMDRLMTFEEYTASITN